MNEFSGKMTNKHLLRKIIVWAVILIAVFIVGFITATAVSTSNKKNETEVETKSTVTVNVLEELVRPASDLITTKYHYKDLMKYDNGKKFLANEQEYLIYEGTVSIGINISDLEFNINEASKIITVGIPEPSVKSHECELVESEKTKNSIFTDSDENDINAKKLEFKEQQQNSLLNNSEFLVSLKTNTQNTIRSFLKGSSLTDGYTINFKELPNPDDPNEISEM